ncbi:MAG: RagB/SusD family nutrient uptake outer membrane protein, partial [Gallicola sp.]|nr:RagB/SusD family nutrient uptake outer membrane protein [Gallicola sp.]
FRDRNSTMRFLFTCYASLPKDGIPDKSPNSFAGNDLWLYYYSNFPSYDLANQNKNEPILNYWDGSRDNKNIYVYSLWEGIRNCNIFIDKIIEVPDIQDWEKKNWIAEAKFLKAYYHFYLLRLYGPIPIMDKSLPVTANTEDVRVKRESVEKVFDYIVKLLDEAALDLPEKVMNENEELGRLVKPVALAMKAKVLVYSASPFYNGNTDYANFLNKDGAQMFEQAYSEKKWQKAMNAAKEAIELCHSLGYSLYEFERTPSTKDIDDRTVTKLSLRNAFTEKWNREIIWSQVNSGSYASGIQTNSVVPFLGEHVTSPAIPSVLVTYNMAELFYSKNGVPINEDVEYEYNNRLQVRTVSKEYKLDLEPKYQTAYFNFDREPRYYATLGFDGGAWYGQGRFDDKQPYYVHAKSK